MVVVDGGLIIGLSAAPHATIRQMCGLSKLTPMMSK